MVRTKIQASMILNRLHDCVSGKLELTSNQVKAAQILLAKAIPDLQRTELTGKDGKDLQLVQASNSDSKL